MLKDQRMIIDYFYLKACLKLFHAHCKQRTMYQNLKLEIQKMRVAAAEGFKSIQETYFFGKMDLIIGKYDYWLRETCIHPKV